MLLLTMSGLYLAAWIGQVSGTYDLYGLLRLDPSVFWKGRVWTMVTYALLPAGLLDFLFNSFLIVWLGVAIERAWSPWELWSFCLLTAAGAGGAKILLARLDPSMIVGATVVVYGLLVAWIRLHGHQRVTAWGIGETTVLRFGLVLMALSAVFMLSRAGWVNTAVVLSGGLTGWLYLTLRWKLNRARPGQSVESQRIRRLEL